MQGLSMPPTDSDFACMIDIVISYFHINARVNPLSISGKFYVAESWDIIMIV